TPRTGGDRVVEKLHQFRTGPQGGFLPAAHDPGGDLACEALFAVDAEYPREVVAVVLRQDVRRGLPRRGVHPHVQRGVDRVREAARSEERRVGKEGGTGGRVWPGK